MADGPQAQWSDYAKPGPYTTALAPDEEQKFQGWVKQNKVPWKDSPTSDYDMRGYWKAQQGGDAQAKTEINPVDKKLHYPDTWKTPYHKTFSNESQYALPTAGHWEGQNFVAPKKMADTPQRYDTAQLDEVQHPTLGPLKFPHAMPPDERNKIIADMETKAAPAATADAPRKAGFFEPQRSVDPNYSPLKEAAQPFIGAAKGAGSTFYNLANLANKGLRAAGQGVGLGEATDKYIPPFPANKPDELKPGNTGQKIGFAGEQIAEFAAPGGLVSRGAKAVDAGINAARLTPFASSALKLGARGALEGASAGAVTEAQGGDVKTNAAIGAATPFAGAALGKIAQVASDTAAPAVANKLLRPVPTQLEKAARYGRNPGQAIADEGIVATSHADLLDKIQAKKSEVGKVIGDQLSTAAQSGKTIDVRPLIEKPINDAVQDVVKGKIEGGQAMIDKLEEIRNTYLNDRQLQNGKLAVTGPKNTVLPVDEAHALKRQIGDNTKWSEDELTQAANDVKRNIYKNINDEVSNAVPGVRKDQMRYGNLLEAEKSAERESARHAARNPFGLLDMIAGASTGGGILAHGGDPLIAAGAGVGASVGLKALRSPLAQSAMVQMLKNSPKAVTPEMLQAARSALLGARSTGQQ